MEKIRINIKKQVPIIRFISCLFLIYFCFQSQHLSAQTPLLNLSMKKVSLHEILKEIKNQSGKNIVYNNNLIDEYNDETVDLKDANLEDALKQVLEGKELYFKIVEDVIIIEPKADKQEVEKSTGLFQNVKGAVFDIESNTPLIGATVLLLESNPPKGGATDLDGHFKIEKVPIGRYSIQISYIGYEPTIVSEVLVTSGKELVINIGLKQAITQMKEVTVNAYSRKDKPLNTMASISARSFSVEETRRYAGGLDDPARLASAFAGVTTGSIDNNGIVIRGNSSKGISWRLEGVEIPDPNHFGGGIAGGGLVTIFSSQMLSNSNFYTGAFPAEYGNALAGIFDIKFRNGNSEKREYTFQAGLLGIDISSEGPFAKSKNSSYLFNYRYSTFGLMSDLGLIPKSYLPKYQDLSFKLNFPTQKKGTFSLWGIVAIDNNQLSVEYDSTKWETDMNRYLEDSRQNTDAVGITHKILIGNQTYINTTIAGTGIMNRDEKKHLEDNLTLTPNYLFVDNSGKIILSSFINHKVNAKLTLKTGFNHNALFYNLNINKTKVNNIPETYQNFVKANGRSSFSEFYVQSKYSILSNLTIYPGINSIFFALNNNYSIDPRFSVKWDIKQNQSISFGFGKHSQLEKIETYLVNRNLNGEIVYPNKNLKISHAQHFVLGYDWLINNNLRLKIEPYYQYLYDLPGKPNSYYSLLNSGNSYDSYVFVFDSLTNNSNGRNLGIDFTFERFLHNNYYYLVTASIFESKYKGGDGVWRNTRFDKGYVINLLFGKEFSLKNNRAFGANVRFNFMGSERVSPVLIDKSLQEKDVYYDTSKAYENQMPPTYNLDISITYRINKLKYSSVWALQIKNALGSPMYHGYDYYQKSASVELTKDVVILPVLSYKIEF